MIIKELTKHTGEGTVVVSTNFLSIGSQEKKQIFFSTVAMLCWNKALWLDDQSHVTFIQSALYRNIA